MMRRVVVTGLGAVTPIGLDVQSSWERALAGDSGIDYIEHFDVSDYRVKVAAQVKGFDPKNYMDVKDANRTSRFIQLAVAASKEAINDAGLEGQDALDRCGVSIGVGIGGIDDTVETAGVIDKFGPRKVSPFFIPYIIPNMAAGVVANTLNLKGPNICISTACTSGTHGIGEAYLYVKNGMADAMLCGGSESALCRLTVVAFGNMKALTTESENPKSASRPFDLNRNGFVIGEGSGVLIIEEYEAAKARGAKIYAEIVGYGMSGDAHHITAPPPGGEGAQRCMDMALKSGGVPKDQVDYINAHGTSTKLNDQYESEAIGAVFGDQAKKLAVSSTKGVTGHCLGAAGGVEGVFLAKAIAEQCVPPTANLRTPDPDCPLDYVPLDARSMKIRYGMSNSFGFGGTNGTIILKAI